MDYLVMEITDSVIKLIYIALIITFMKLSFSSWSTLLLRQKKKEKKTLSQDETTAPRTRDE